MVMLRGKLNNVSPLLKYLYYSSFVTIFDVAVVWVLFRPLHINIVIANTIGVVAGFVLHYLLASRSVFNSEYGIIGFALYLGTFLFGIVLANVLIYVSQYYIFTSLQADIRFLLSKGISIVVPFFIVYYVRKFLFGIAKKYNWG